MEPETAPEAPAPLFDDAAPNLPRHRASVRAVALASFLGLLGILALVVGWVPTTGLAAAWNQTWNQAAHPPLSAAEQHKLATLVAHAAASFTHETSVTVGSLRSVQVTATLAWTNDITAADVPQEQARVKALCFQVQKAIWSSALSPSDVLVIVLGPIADGYAQPDIDAHGTAELSANTASRLAWGTLTPDAAWAAYDHAYLRPSYIWYVL